VGRKGQSNTPSSTVTASINTRPHENIPGIYSCMYQCMCACIVEIHDIFSHS
jgi:hypothetical protein